MRATAAASRLARRAVGRRAVGGQAVNTTLANIRSCSEARTCNFSCKDTHFSTSCASLVTCDPTGVLAHTGRLTLSLAACLQNVAHGVVERERCSHFLQSVSADRLLSEINNAMMIETKNRINQSGD